MSITVNINGVDFALEVILGVFQDLAFDKTNDELLALLRAKEAEFAIDMMETDNEEGR